MWHNTIINLTFHLESMVRLKYRYSVRETVSGKAWLKLTQFGVWLSKLGEKKNLLDQSQDKHIAILAILFNCNAWTIG